MLRQTLYPVNGQGCQVWSPSQGGEVPRIPIGRYRARCNPAFVVELHPPVPREHGHDGGVDASAASLTGMAFTAAASCQSLWLASLWGGRAPTATQLQRATTRVLGAGLAPYQKAVRSNVKRLKK